MGLQRLLKQGSFHLEPTRSALNHVRNHAAYFAMFALAHALQPTGSAIILLTHAPFNTHYLFSIPLPSLPQMLDTAFPSKMLKSLVSFPHT